jgi:hypothetical protein
MMAVGVFGGIAMARPISRSALCKLLGCVAPAPASADQGGISFWLPGAFGSLAAAPATPGWALGTIYLHSSVRAGGEVAASRAIRLGDRTTNLPVNLDARLRGDVDLALFAPSYTFGSPVFGGQLAVSLLGIVATCRDT